MRFRRLLRFLQTFRQIRMTLFRILRSSDAIIVARQLTDHSIAFSPAGNIGRALFVRGEYQRADLELVLELLQNHQCLTQGKTALDIGSNIGTQTIYMMLSGQFSNVVAIEPEPRNFKILNLNLALNNFEQSVKPLMVAVGEADGEMPLYLNSDNFSCGGHSLVPQSSAAVVKVQTRTVHSILQDAGIRPEEISFCWIDVEGFDELCLRQFVNAAGPLVPIFTEIGHDSDGKEGAERFLAFINSTYTYKYVFNKDQSPPVFFDGTDAHFKGAKADILAFNPVGV